MDTPESKYFTTTQEELVRDAQRYRMLRRFVLPTGYFDNQIFTRRCPCAITSWGGTCRGQDFTEEVLDELVDEMIKSADKGVLDE
jgi:hypothetical protein